MQKYYIVLLLAVLINFSQTASAGSLPLDSIGVENLNGKKLIIHKVAQHDTYYSISRRYNIPPKVIMTYNDNKYLQIGVIIKVPTALAFTANVTGIGAAVIAEGPENATFIEHVVQKKENLNFLAGKYGTTVNEIKRINNLNSINLSIGQVLKMPNQEAQIENTPAIVPVTTPTTSVQTPPVVAKPVQAIIPSVQQAQPPVRQPQPVKQQPRPVTSPAAKTTDTTYEDLIVHTVASNETIYSIATSYNMTMDQVKAKNNLTANTLRIGQKLLIKGQYGQRSKPQIGGTDTLTSITDPSLRGAASRYGLNQIDERGTAISIQDADLDPNKMLVLHRTAPIGTVMKITNPMSNRSTFAKVVGKFTENESTKDVVVVMTHAVAEALGALDKRFYCNITYSGQENNEQ
jgi:peptidoglycan endopeptidase LytF